MALLKEDRFDKSTTVEDGFNYREEYKEYKKQRPKSKITLAEFTVRHQTLTDCRSKVNKLNAQIATLENRCNQIWNELYPIDS